MNDMDRLKAAAFHDVTPETPEIEVSSNGFSVDFLSKDYRLAFVGEFLYLTDRPGGYGCTCHGKGVESIDELIALLQEARKIMSERGT